MFDKAILLWKRLKNKGRLLMFITRLSIVLIALAATSVSLVAEEATSPIAPETPTVTTTAPASDEPHAATVRDAMKAIDDAITAVNADQKDQALSALSRAKELLGKVTPMAEPGKSAVVFNRLKVANRFDPVTGERLPDPNNVYPGLVREFNGQKIGFSCMDCPITWDKMNDARRQAAFNKAMNGPATSTQP